MFQEKCGETGHPWIARCDSIPSRQALPVILEEQMPCLEGELPSWGVQQHAALICQCNNSERIMLIGR